MDGLVIISILILGGLIVRKLQPSTVRGLEDKPVSIEDIRRGVANGWYTAVLVVADGTPAVRLSGRLANGKTYTDIYPVTESDWQTLKNEGYEVVTL